MRSRKFGNSQRLTGIFRLCLCLAVAGIIILGAADRTTAASSATGSLPVIKVFSADPLTLKDGDSAKYTFEVSGATDMKVVENGVIIKEIKSPPNTTLKGTVRGNKTYEIQTGHINTFITTLEAMNASGRQVKTLTLSFATAPQAKSLNLSAGQRGSDNRTPRWGPETYSIVTSSNTVPTIQATWPPTFAKCPSGCNYCLRPEDAAARGLTRKCSNQPCYYSPDKTQYWYCYGDFSSDLVVGWFCSGGQVSQGTQTDANKVGATWYATKDEAQVDCTRGMVLGVRACWHCVGGQATEINIQGTDNCSSANMYSSQAEAQGHCQQSSTCWRCINGQVAQSTTNVASDFPCYPTQTQAQAACQQSSTCYRCVGGQVYQSTTNVASDSPCYSTYSQAATACTAPTTTNTNTATPATAMCYCCHGGEVTYATQSACAQAGGTCYSSSSAATAGCRSSTTTSTPCYCCHGGKVAQTSQSACAEIGGTCYSSQSAATAGCTSTLQIPYKIPNVIPKTLIKP
ncbi:MAG: hypothetical protein NTZ34_03935 [Chloroflexi bacterium]|nr:hypothetical protein [Chloroflexota bacterium]